MKKIYLFFVLTLFVLASYGQSTHPVFDSIALKHLGTTTAAPNIYVGSNGWLKKSTNTTFGTYYAGNGLYLTGQTFYHNSHRGDVSGKDTLTVIALQGYAINTTGFTTGSVLSLSGSTWVSKTTDTSTVKTPWGWHTIKFIVP